MAATSAALLAMGAGGCGGSPAKPVTTVAAEINPAGDIPDNQAFVAYAPAGQGFSVKTPEGWSRSASGATVTLTDKLNSIRVQRVSAAAPLTVRDAKQIELPKLAASVAGFASGAATSVRRRAGMAIRMTYLAGGGTDGVTGKSHTNAVERYVFFHKGHDLILTLTGPKGADNVDPWRIVTDSVRWTS